MNKSKKKAERPTAIFITEINTGKKYTLREISDLTGIELNTIRQRHTKKTNITFEEICQSLKSQKITEISKSDIDNFITINDCSNELGYTIKFICEIINKLGFNYFNYQNKKYIEKINIISIKKYAEQYFNKLIPKKSKNKVGRRDGKVEVQLLLPNKVAGFLRHRYGTRKKGGVSGHIAKIAMNDPHYQEYAAEVQ